MHNPFKAGWILNDHECFIFHQKVILMKLLLCDIIVIAVVSKFVKNVLIAVNALHLNFATLD